jgi:hypothetical protein
MFWTKNKTALIALLAVSLIGGVTRAADVTVEENITYGKGGETELTLDIARPDGDGPFPAIVFIHGGGWYQGSRQGYRGQIMEAAKRGYVAATISYPEFKGNVAAVYSHPLSKGGSSGGHYGGNAETYMNVGEAMGRAMVELLKAYSE